jgi:hypothetical protein
MSRKNCAAFTFNDKYWYIITETKKKKDAEKELTSAALLIHFKLVNYIKELIL